MIHHKYSVPCILALASLAFAQRAVAADAATYSGVHGNDLVPYWGPGQGQDNIGYTFNGSTGFFFVPSQDIEVSALGVMDVGAPGLVADHFVGIYENVDPNVVPCNHCTVPRQVTGDLVTSAIIGAGMSGDFTSGWSRYVDLAAPVVLEAGVEYYIVTDNMGCDPVAWEWFGYCEDADNSDQDMSVFGSTAVSFDSRIVWTGYANSYDVATGDMWDLDESWQVPPGLGVNGNIGPVFWIEDDQCVYDPKGWARNPTWPVASLTYSGANFNRTQLERVLRRITTNPIQLLRKAVVAADLNFANGSDPALVQATRDSAVALLDSVSRAPWVSPAQLDEANLLRAPLESYNRGLLGPAACPPP